MYMVIGCNDGETKAEILAYVVSLEKAKAWVNAQSEEDILKWGHIAITKVVYMDMDTRF